MITLKPACKEHAREIARAVMAAMGTDCCKYLIGANGTLDQFEEMMTDLASLDNSQYSYTNAIVALDDDGAVAGTCVGYDGARLNELRPLFLDALLHYFGKTLEHITDETIPGEYYIDSLMVKPEYRCQGIASRLIQAMTVKAEEAGLPAALIVDTANPNAERLYTSLGFVFKDYRDFGGHKMKHMVRESGIKQ